MFIQLSNHSTNCIIVERPLNCQVVFSVFLFSLFLMQWTGQYASPLSVIGHIRPAICLMHISVLSDRQNVKPEL